MRKDNTKANIETQSVQHLKVVQTERHSVQVELEIENHVRSIRTLINKLHPVERQKYFNGLLNHLLHEDVSYPFGKGIKADKTRTASNDFSNLSHDDLELIRELSCKLQDLYAHSGDTIDS